MKILCLLTVFLSSAVSANPVSELKDLLLGHDQKETLNSLDWQKAAKAISQERESFKCQDDKLTSLGAKYKVSFDAQGQPCRIYDLSFPNLKSFMKDRTLFQLSTQSFSVRDYLDWLAGRHENVLQRIENFKKSQFAFPAPWVAKLRLKNDGFLPNSFRASDLRGSDRFRFSSEEQQKLLAALRAVYPEIPEALEDIIQDPQVLLNLIRFQWKDTDRVYEVFIEGEFLPVRGPIALVDYSRGYKPVLEAALRQVLKQALGQAAKLVSGTAGQVIGIVLDAGFTLSDMAYEYQRHALEMALVSAQRGELKTDLKPEQIALASDLLFAANSPILQDYLKTVLQNQDYDWSQFALTGQKARIKALKQRQSLLSKQSSAKSCPVEYEYFGFCEGKVYSFISEKKVLNKSLGAPLIFNYDRIYQTIAKRATAFTLAMAAGLVDLPLPGRLKAKLPNILLDYAQAGINDEALLRTQLFGQQLDEKTELLYTWLFRQNINPFLPKSAEGELETIQKNSELIAIESH